MIRINPEENNGDYAYCEECKLKYRREWAIQWHLISVHGGKQNEY